MKRVRPFCKHVIRRVILGKCQHSFAVIRHLPKPSFRINGQMADVQCRCVSSTFFSIFFSFRRFCLAIKPGGLIRVHTSALQPTSLYKSLVISEETTSDELLTLLLTCCNSSEPVEQFSIYEVSEPHHFDLQCKFLPSNSLIRLRVFSFSPFLRCALVRNINANYIRTICHCVRNSNESKKATNVISSFARILIIHAGDNYCRPSLNRNRCWSATEVASASLTTQTVCHRMHLAWVHCMMSSMRMQTVNDTSVCMPMRQCQRHSRSHSHHHRRRYAKCVAITSARVNSATKMWPKNSASVWRASQPAIIYSTSPTPPSTQIALECMRRPTIPSTTFAKSEPSAIHSHRWASTKNCWTSNGIA